MNAPFFNQSERHTVLAGVLSSSLFFSMIVVGNLFSNVTWLTLVPCLVISCGIAGTVHRVCITVCFLCSIAITLYMQYMSKRLSQKGASAVGQSDGSSMELSIG